MCGICGAIQVGGEPRRVLAPDVLDRMTDTMTHRGPNDRGTHMTPGAALGARRLSIVDLAAGHQPFASEDESIWAIQNGELYNHETLREELRAEGHRFTSRCDTEVIPHLYEREGERFPEQLWGKFGLALWDGRRRRGVIARDRLGVKPLYYARAGDLVLFASELKSLLASGLVGTDLDYEAISTYLSLGYFPAPATPLAQVRKLRPGELLVVGGGHVRSERYWTYPEPQPEQRPEEEWSELLLDGLEEGVKRRLMSDVPLGAMLSGGLDSSLIVALMARNMSEPVKTFSVGFREDGEFNELSDARRVADHYGADHHELELSFTDDAVSLETLVWHMDEPLADLSALGFLLLSELAARHVTVALSGQGADELLGGYLKHRAAALLASVPERARPAAGALAARGPRRTRRAGRTLSARTAAERVLAMSGKLDDARRAELVRGPLAEHADAPLRAVAAVAGGVSAHPLDETLFVDAQLALPDDMLHYFDRASMAYSLEVRVPFLDHHLVELCARIPPELKVRGLTTKYVLKRAARGLVPDWVIDKRKIGFFRGATDAWLEAQVDGALADFLLQPRPAFDGMLDRGAVERLVAERRGGERGGTHLLLAILLLEIWLQTYLPRAIPPAVPARERIAMAS